MKMTTTDNDDDGRIYEAKIGNAPKCWNKMKWIVFFLYQLTLKRQMVAHSLNLSTMHEPIGRRIWMPQYDKEQQPTANHPKIIIVKFRSYEWRTNVILKWALRFLVLHAHCFFGSGWAADVRKRKIVTRPKNKTKTEQSNAKEHLKT